MNEVIEYLKMIMVDTSFDESFYELVVKRLDSLGHEVKSEDAWVIGYCINTIESFIRIDCNITTVPKLLYYYACDAVCGEFLKQLYSTGKLDDSFNIDRALQSLTEGDVSITFGNDLTNDAKLKLLIDSLLHGRDGELVCFRRIRW